MASNLVQGDLDTVWTAAQNGGTGAYNEIGTDVGEFRVGSISSDFEKNVATLIALVEFLVANTDDPSASVTAYESARRQRKLLKDLLIKMCIMVKPTADYSADDRQTVADRVMDKTIIFYNLNNRPDTIQA